MSPKQALCSNRREMIVKFPKPETVVRGYISIEKPKKQNQKFERKLILCLKDVSKLDLLYSKVRPRDVLFRHQSKWAFPENEKDICLTEENLQ